MRIRFSERATLQLAEIKAYIAEHDPLAARRVIRTIRAAAEGLKRFPQAHRVGDVDGTRELILPRLPYIIVYRADERRVTILGVFHAARHPSVRSRP